MTRRAFALFLILTAGVLSASAPALAAQPYPVNFKTFSLAAADSVRDGTVLSGGALTLASTGLASFA